MASRPGSTRERPPAPGGSTQRRHGSSGSPPGAILPLWGKEVGGKQRKHRQFRVPRRHMTQWGGHRAGERSFPSALCDPE